MGIYAICGTYFRSGKCEHYYNSYFFVRLFCPSGTLHLRKSRFSCAGGATARKNYAAVAGSGWETATAAGFGRGEGGTDPGRCLAVVVVIGRVHAADRRLLPLPAHIVSPLPTASLPPSSSSCARHFRLPPRRHYRPRACCSRPPPRCRRHRR